ncbi:VOC family protein [Rhizorhabdus histidinilytica]|uniref:Glyoxalase/Bleomycin resistance protein/Dioxygenase superfamily protein n=1 Tax=Rhizorhabdus histidinilytica TaxID=439228 RepID=A0A1T5FT80_9SPHN|nr:VOC family protein [Rhizorhabdus histidinilytica]SKB99379.1 Glyoxalase/Bleomycin resistance protein/Dioxygenase superfamily protein [Rhizorhabdus histidinilytica]
MSAALPLTGFYQFGFVTRDLDAATARLGARYGIAHFRRRQANPWMETAHAYAGPSMIEIIAVGEAAPALYRDHLPDDGIARLHHLGYRIAGAAGWEALEEAISASGLAAPMKGAVMDGHLRYAYVDTRADLGIYTEYVCLTGPAERLYDDVPRH